ncbi:DsbA family protein [Microbacterium keratanolyticum]|uniref:DsbA family protein n=1 Tax=Microbacterium keratanolyticum TaxID=67574 RepID=UPI00363797AC
MSSDETPNVPTTRNSREAVREKAQQVHAQQSRARVIRRSVLGVVAVLVVGGIAAGVVWAVSSSASKPELTPSNMKDDGVVLRAVSAEDTGEIPATPTPDDATATPAPTALPTVAAGAVDIHVYVDYLSPGAGQFERANARQLASWIDQGAATVAYHPVALLTANSSGTKYSLRAAAASACVASLSNDKFAAYNHELLLSQPELDTAGKSDEELADIAVAVGVERPKDVRACIQGKDFASWAKDATARALEGPLPGSKDLVLNGAPTIVVNGRAYVGALDDPAEFSQFVQDIASDAYFSTPSPTPTPTPTETVPAS